MKVRAATIARFALFIGIVAAGIWVSVYITGNVGLAELIARYGYAGLFVLSFASGFNLAVPVPAVAFLPSLAAAGLYVPACVAVMTLGMTAADTIAFYAGRTGREMMHGGEVKAFQHIERLRSKHAWAPVLAMFAWAAFAPLPNEMLAVPLGFMGFRARHIVPAIFFGNVVFNSLFGIGVLTLSSAI